MAELVEESVESQKYTISHAKIETILGWIRNDEIGIPEIQRPFVWESTDVTKLIESLYKGLPIGYFVTWKDADTRLQEGGVSIGKKILIDGQQRVKALMSSLLEKELIDKDYKKLQPMKIAFNPIKEQFVAAASGKAKGNEWIPDISPIVTNRRINARKIEKAYLEKNPDADEDQVVAALDRVAEISKKEVGITELAGGLDLDTVADVFVRVNNTGKNLTKADFVMAKIAAYGNKNEGSELRKCIDLFCHLSRDPDYYHTVKNDTEFAKTDYFKKISWLKDEKEDIFDPDITDVLRVAFGVQFKDGKLGSLLNGLAGRNPKTREFEDRIKHKTFKDLVDGVKRTIDKTSFQRFTTILIQAGFVINYFLSGSTAVAVTYILYLSLRKEGEKDSKIQRLVKKWFVMATLTGRYSGSTETVIDDDLTYFKKDQIEQYLKKLERENLHAAFWDEELISKLTQYNSKTPYLGVFRAARVANNEKVFLSRDMTIQDLVTHTSNIHHIYPQNYLQKHGMNHKKFYNQSANFAYLDQVTNIQIGDKSPKEYMGEVRKQCKGGDVKYGGIDDVDMLEENMKENCIPESIFDGTVKNYESFLEERRKLMAQKIRDYYSSL